MQNKQDITSQVGDHSMEWVKRLEQTGMTVAESLSQIVGTVEAVALSISKFFDTLKRQKDTVVDFGHTAGEKIRPVAESGIKMLKTSRNVSSRLITRSRQNPMPFVIGGIAVVGGIALLAYYLREEKQQAEESERDIFDTRAVS